MKKLFAVLLVVTMVVVCCSGTTVIAQEAPIKVTASLQLHSEDRYEEGLAFWGEIAARHGIELELITFSSDVSAEKQNTILASGNLPDLFYTTSGNANLYGIDGMFEPLDGLMETMPNLSALTAETDITVRRAANGQLYYFPKYAPLYQTTEGTMTYRKDILEEMGESEPTTLEGWYELYKKVQTTYPDMIVLMERSAGINGQMLTAFGMTNTLNNCGILIQGDEREVAFLPTSENWKAMLEWYHRLYDEGILYEGYATVDYSLWWDQTICTDKAFACNTQNFNRAFEATEAANGLGFENVQWWVATQPQNPFTNTNEVLITNTAWQGYGLAVAADSDVKEHTALFVDWFYGDECIAEQINMMEEAGKELAFLYWPIHMVNLFAIRDVPLMQDHFTKNSPLVKLMPVVTVTPEGTQRMVDETEGLGDYVNQMRDEFVMGLTPFSEWDNYVAECEALGANVAVEIVQGYMDAYYAIGG